VESSITLFRLSHAWPTVVVGCHGNQALVPFSFTHITGSEEGLDVMSDRLDMEQLKRKEFAKRTRWLVWVESSVILGLLVWVSLEYENNPFLQSWAKTNIGPASFLLNGTLAGLYAGTMLGYMISKYLGTRTEKEKILETIRKRA